jgi:hypothetical protein
VRIRSRDASFETCHWFAALGLAHVLVSIESVLVRFRPILGVPMKKKTDVINLSSLAKASRRPLLIDPILDWWQRTCFQGAVLLAKIHMDSTIFHKAELSIWASSILLVA